jgi:hypothetical protein
MAQLGIFENAPKKWVQFDSDSEVSLQYVDKEQLGKLIKQANEVSQKIKTPQGTAYDMFLGKTAVHGWRNINDHSQTGLMLPGNIPIPFTPGNRNMLMIKSRDFSEFVFQKCTNASLFLDDATVELVEDPETIEKLMEEYSDEEPKN